MTTSTRIYPPVTFHFVALYLISVGSNSNFEIRPMHFRSIDSHFNYCIIVEI